MRARHDRSRPATASRPAPARPAPVAPPEPDAPLPPPERSGPVPPDGSAGSPEPSAPLGRPANRAERRAAARGRAVDHQEGSTTPTRSGPQARTRPAHVRTDFVARRGG